MQKYFISVAISVTLLLASNSAVSATPTLIRTWDKVPKGCEWATFQEDPSGNVIPEVAAGTGQMFFFDSTGDIKSTYDFSPSSAIKIIRSPNGTCYGVWTVPKGTATEENGIRQTFTVLDAKGREVWRKNNVFISALSDEDKSGVECQDYMDGTGKTTFLGPNGTKQEFQPLSGTRFLTTFGEFSSDGKYCLQMIGNPPTLILYHDQESIVWTKNLGHGRVNSFGISPTGKYSVALTYDVENHSAKTSCIGNDGNVLWTKDGIGGDGICRFSLDEKYLLICDSIHKTMALFEPATGHILWQKSSSFEGDRDHAWAGTVTSVAVSSSAGYVAIAKSLSSHTEEGPLKDRRGEKREIRVSDLQGNVVYSFAEKSDPSVQIIGNELFTISNDGITEYSLKP